MMLYVKDRYNVSGTAYHEMARLCKEMPRHLKLKQKISELNRLWETYPTPNGTTGVQQSFRRRRQERLRILIQNTPSDVAFKQAKRVCVKLSGDGTNIGKRLHVLNFTFTMQDEREKAYSAECYHVLDIVKVSVPVP